MLELVFLTAMAGQFGLPVGAEIISVTETVSCQDGTCQLQPRVMTRVVQPVFRRVIERQPVRRVIRLVPKTVQRARHVVRRVLPPYRVARPQRLPL